MAIADTSSRAQVPQAAPGRRSQALYRLQVGGLGLGFILFVVGIASVVIDRAQEVEQTAVPEAKIDPPEPAETQASDPLAEIGVVPSPEPATPTPTTSSTTSDVPPAPPSE
jgi:hypothetical protein